MPVRPTRFLHEKQWLGFSGAEEEDELAVASWIDETPVVEICARLCWAILSGVESGAFSSIEEPMETDFSAAAITDDCGFLHNGIPIIITQISC